MTTSVSIKNFSWSHWKIFNPFLCTICPSHNIEKTWTCQLQGGDSYLSTQILLLQMCRVKTNCSRSSWCLTCVGLAGCVWRKSHRTGWAGFQCFYNSKRVSESKLQYRKRKAPYTALVTPRKPVWWAKKTNCSTDMDISSSASTKVSWASECLMSVTCNNQQASVLCSREPTTWCFWGRVLF